MNELDLRNNDIPPETNAPDEEETDFFDEGLLSFIESMDVVKPPAANVIIIPEELERDDAYSGKLYGFLRLDSGYHVALCMDGKEPNEALGAEWIGSIGDAPMPENAPFLVGEWENGQSRFFLQKSPDVRIPLQKEVYSLRQKLFSRHSGLIETDWMDKKCVVIVGCGSVGSAIALQMARSGVGRFVLLDADCVEINNVCRHQCSLRDVGRFKADALEERILQINPYALVRKRYQRIQQAPASTYSGWADADNALFIGACDNRVGNACACDAANEQGAPFLAIGYMARAWAGELFIQLPERGDICYRCAFRKQIENDVTRERRNHLYVGEEDAGKVHFEPGLDVDLEYGTSLADKVALDILNRSNPQYHPRILPTLSQLTFFSGTQDRPAEGREFWDAALPRPLDYRSVKVSPKCRRPDCPYCSKV